MKKRLYISLSVLSKDHLKNKTKCCSIESLETLLDDSTHAREIFVHQFGYNESFWWVVLTSSNWLPTTYMLLEMVQIMVLLWFIYWYRTVSSIYQAIRASNIQIYANPLSKLKKGEILNFPLSFPRYSQSKTVLFR